MKYSLYINQKQAIDLGISNINQAHIFDLLTGMAAWAEPVVIDGVIFYWAARQVIARDLALLNMKPDTVYRHLKSLQDLGLINYTKDGKKDCVKITDKGKTYYVGNRSELAQDPEIDPTKLGNRSEKHSDLNPTYPTTIKHQALKRETRAKFIRPTELIIDAYAEEKKLNLIGFFDHYESNGWMVGRSQMKNWQATARNWNRRQPEFGGKNGINEHSSQLTGAAARTAATLERIKSM